MHAQGMFSVNFWELAVIEGFQCVKPGHTPIFRKPARTPGQEPKKRTCLGKPRRMVTLS